MQVHLRRENMKLLCELVKSRTKTVAKWHSLCSPQNSCYWSGLSCPVLTINGSLQNFDDHDANHKNLVRKRKAITTAFVKTRRNIRTPGLWVTVSKRKHPYPVADCCHVGECQKVHNGHLEVCEGQRGPGKMGKLQTMASFGKPSVWFGVGDRSSMSATLPKSPSTFFLMAMRLTQLRVKRPNTLAFREAHAFIKFPSSKSNTQHPPPD